ncbi:hypothetical protein IFR05_000165 [Cadophora sp. M221]|nr:hypothetical protein IFR05_000165 [Cadophora sp. M221]
MTHTGSSSTKAHSGSHKGSASRTSSTSHKHKYSTPSSSTTKKMSSEERVERFVQDERDHRSLVVEEFDNHQEAAKQSHGEKLKDVVEKEY